MFAARRAQRASTTFRRQLTSLFGESEATTTPAARSAAPSPRTIATSRLASMFIQTQNTPNPSSLMFLPGEPVLEKGGHNFASAREAMASPLAKRLFVIDGVENVFFGTEFITVSKSEDHAWSTLKPEIFAAITEHYSSQDPIMNDGEQADSTTINDDDSETIAMIKELLETRIRPAVQEDGGDIVFVDYAEATGVVTLKLLGACDGCPSSSITLKSGIENMIKHYVPEVTEVREAPPDEAEAEGLKAFQRLEDQLSA
jgi:Fe-S cluster biogenesis protein NfuA